MHLWAERRVSTVSYGIEYWKETMGEKKSCWSEQDDVSPTELRVIRDQFKHNVESIYWKSPGCKKGYIHDYICLRKSQPDATSAVVEFPVSAHTLPKPALPIKYFCLSSLKPEREVQTGRSAQVKMGQIGRKVRK